MMDKDIRSEIEELKARLESLSRARTGESAPGADSHEAGEGGGEHPPGGWFSDVLKQAEELWSGLDIHLQDVPVKPALVIFALGVLTGRLLSRRD